MYVPPSYMNTINDTHNFPQYASPKHNVSIILWRIIILRIEDVIIRNVWLQCRSLWQLWWRYQMGNRKKYTNAVANTKKQTTKMDGKILHKKLKIE